MSAKLTVGICQKIGQPDFGWLGASCSVEVEVDPSLIFDDVVGLQMRVKQAYAACRQAVNEELTRQQVTTNTETTNGKAASQASSASPTKGNNGHRASQKQLDYAQQLAGQIHGLGVRRLEKLAGKLFDKPVADLSNLEASELIDVLKDIKAGKIELATTLHGAAR